MAENQVKKQWEKASTWPHITYWPPFHNNRTMIKQEKT
jgi:hypothetical protein